MTEATDSIHCDQHGPARAACVCSHLFRQPIQRWHSDAPTPDTPHPDAWCTSCNAALQAGGGEWNEHNATCLDVQVLCHHCYQSAQASSVQALDGAVRDAWIDTVTEGHHALVDKQRGLEADFGLSTFERWDYDQAAGTLTFSQDSVARVVADIEFIGSVSEASGTWRWAWANFHNAPRVVSRIGAVRDYGEAHGFLHLTVPQWAGDATDGWEVSGVAADVLGARGVYRVPGASGFLYMALMKVQRTG
ncbi:MAG: hypothetical protein QE495_17935 [Acidovorax sp.]|jgi:hypothetical protein|uniref:DUF6882 domain-containing protein n=1 Tax=Acidovorax sp. TaxID=1872122 RepID=UPI0025C08E8A|nr:DUF6882 domain-containing protein [Acidovorax sp.]MDH4428335.1 hypothetical protein [Acidovorax sp.]MDH4446900.1 hypothetical protein [Acidovorax sp.]